VLPGWPFDLMMIGVARSGFSPRLTPELSYKSSLKNPATSARMDQLPIR
jgi:hypothetical protein